MEVDCDPLNAPSSSRLKHTAFWTGEEMIDWGGMHNESFKPNRALDVGARYRPELNRWFPMSSSGAPLQRFEHSAIWTGDLMMVWAGDVNSPRQRCW